MRKTGQGPNFAGRGPLKQEDKMTVKAILEKKGHAVVTLGPNEKLSEAVRLLAEHRIGALVITNGDQKIVGILSERDIVRSLSKEGAAALDSTVRAAMTPKVKICNENHTVNEVMEIMTQGRFRHIPVEKNGLLYGIISIGDVVKRRIEDVEREAEEIKQYIATA
jgi:CBS domain-containing protein